jgi:hypothetical protein
MSRSGYNDDIDQWQLIRWRGAVASAIKGKRGQAFLKEMLAALDALPEPQLIARELDDGEGAVCALGAVGKARGLDMSALDPDDAETVAFRFGIPDALTREIVFENDESGRFEMPEARFARMRAWVASQIRDPGSTPR